MAISKYIKKIKGTNENQRIWDKPEKKKQKNPNFSPDWVI